MPAAPFTLRVRYTAMKAPRILLALAAAALLAAACSVADPVAPPSTPRAAGSDTTATAPTVASDTTNRNPYVGSTGS